MTSPQIDTSVFKGKCPLCSAQLVEDEQANEFVVCSKNPKEYRIKKADFEAAWEAFDKSMRVASPESKVAIHIYKPAIFALMSVLLNNNVAEEAPPVDQTKWIIE